MTPEQEQALSEHVRAIAQILYDNTAPEQLSSLGSIEQAVREQMLQHVMPEVGIFLFKKLQGKQSDVSAP